MASSSARRWRRISLVAGIVLVVLLAARAALDPLATRFTQNGLDSLEGVEGSFDDVSFSLIALTYDVRGLRLRRPDFDEDVFHADRVHARVLWRNLVRGHVLGNGRIERPRVVLPVRVAREKPDEAPQPRTVDEIVQSLIPIRLERIEVRDGSVTLVDERYASKPRVRFDAIEAAAENFTTRRALDEGRPMTLALRARMQNTGDVSLFVTIDPLAEELSFAGEAKIDGLDLDSLRPMFEASTKNGLVPRGTFHLFAAFRCENGHLTGGIKPMIERPDMVAVEDDVLTMFEEAFVDAGLALFSDRVPGREAAAAVVPIEGHVSNIDVRAWPTVLSVLRNAFVRGLSASFRGLPPADAKPSGTAEKES